MIDKIKDILGLKLKSRDDLIAGWSVKDGYRPNYIAFSPLGVNTFSLPATLKKLSAKSLDLLKLYDHILKKDNLGFPIVVECPDYQAEVFEYLYLHEGGPAGFNRVETDQYRLYEVESWDLLLVRLERIVENSKKDVEAHIKSANESFLKYGEWTELLEVMKKHAEREVENGR